MIHFGPAGNCDMFYGQGYKSTTQMPEFLNSIGLNAYEIQCGRGVRMGADAAAKLKEADERNQEIQNCRKIQRSRHTLRHRSFSPRPLLHFYVRSRRRKTT